MTETKPRDLTEAELDLVNASVGAVADTAPLAVPPGTDISIDRLGFEPVTSTNEAAPDAVPPAALPEPPPSQASAVSAPTAEPPPAKAEVTGQAAAKPSEPPAAKKKPAQKSASATTARARRKSKKDG